jgi:hypothetical protein
MQSTKIPLKSRRRKTNVKNGNKKVSTGVVTLTPQMPNTRGGLCPETITCVLKYQRLVALASGALTYAYESYSLNSPYDPLYTAGGGNCSGFAQWMALYRRFYVKSVRVSSQAVNGTANSVFTFILPLRSSDASGGGIVPTMDYIMESREAAFAFMNINSSIPNGWCLSLQLSPTRFEGLPLVSNREELSGDIASDPLIQPAVYVGYICSTVGLTLSYAIKLEYTVEFWSPRILGDA